MVQKAYLLHQISQGGHYLSSTWKDSYGNFWLFGGLGYGSNNYGVLNDLWKYNPTTNEWTWVSGTDQADQPGNYGTQGIPSVNNIPSGRQGSAHWTDASGNFWLYGGLTSYPNSREALSDLWKYNPNTNEWTWVSGSTGINEPAVYGTQGTPSVNNTPGGRLNPGFWTDNAGNFWLFGGINYTISFDFFALNDLWRYNPNTNEWTWMKGSSSPDSPGIYGTKGVPSSSNTPGSRMFMNNWTDNQGNLWLFGGALPSGGYFNDLWRYNINTNQWTWMKGSNTLDQPGVYGTKGIPSANNTPGARANVTGWTTLSGDLLLYGGDHNGYFADLWKYNINSNEWTWIKGDSILGQRAKYGTKGIPSSNNTPGNRNASLSWQDNSGNIWMFGGVFQINDVVSVYNDLWKLNATYTCNATGTLQREVWSNIPGSTVASIPLNTPPDSVGYITSFEGPTNVANLYGARYRGYICVPVTGDYTFWIASDDDSELWLSTDDNPVNKVKIAYVNGWTYPRTYNKYPSQQSALIHLLAGHTYYIEALHKEAYGNDNLSVGWQLPGGTLERPIPGTRLSPYIEVPPMVTITQPTNGEMFNAPANIPIDATVTGAGEGAYFRISNPSGGYRKFKLGYDNISIYHSTHNVTITGNNKLEITLRDFTGTADWTKIQIRPNGSTAHPLSLAPYVNQIGGVGNEFVSISIPLSDFDPSIDFTQLKMFEVPYSVNAAPFTIGIQKIIFTGGTTPFLWFGDNKTDNSHDGDGSGGQLVASLIPPSGLGGVSKVEFYNGSTKIGEDYTPKFSFVWKNVPEGTYTLTALAKINSGVTATSAPVTISVGPGMAVIFPGAKTGLINSTTSDISVYPNPVQNRVVISQVNEEMKVSVLDEMGNVVFQNKYSEMAGGEADLSKLPSGIYLLKLQGVNTNYSKTVKLIKQ